MVANRSACALLMLLSLAGLAGMIGRGPLAHQDDVAHSSSALAFTPPAPTNAPPALGLAQATASPADATPAPPAAPPLSIAPAASPVLAAGVLSVGEQLSEQQSNLAPVPYLSPEQLLSGSPRPSPPQDEVLAAPVVIATATPTPSRAVDLAAPPMTVEQRGRSLLAQVPFSIESIGYTISFEPWLAGPRGLTWPDTNHIQIFIHPSWSDASIRHVIAHEIGHAVDVATFSQADEDRWRAQRGIPASMSWWPSAAASDFSTPAGDFAECFAWWTTGATPRTTLGDCAVMTDLLAELVPR